MNDQWTLIATWLAIGGAALSSGVFFTFSVFVMPSLSRLTASRAVRSMQEINRYAPGPWFGLALVGTTLVSLVLAISTLLDRDQPGGDSLLAGAVLFILGAVLMTAFGNIPLNNQLDALDPEQDDIGSRWADFLRDWQLRNHARTVLSFVATIAFVVALRQAAGA